MEPDFSGYATKAGLKCSDGRTIMPDAFKHQNTLQVPLVWQHGHNDPTNVLGHAILEHREDGVYAYCYFNKSEKAEHARTLVEHKDISMMSIWANELIEKAGRVLHGAIREVSLVLSGANPGALIENVTIRHSDGDEDILDGDAIIYTGIAIEHEEKSTSDNSDNSDDSDDESEETLADVIETMTEKQKDVLHFMLAQAAELRQSAIDSGKADSSAKIAHDSLGEDDEESVDAAGDNADNATNDADDASGEGTTDDSNDDSTDDSTDDSDDSVDDSTNDSEDGVQHSAGNNNDTVDDNNDNDTDDSKGSIEMKHNVFEDGNEAPSLVLSHSDIEGIVADATKAGSLKAAVEGYALSHGITDIDLMFPEARAVTDAPELFSRRVEWVRVVMAGVRKSPFSRIKTLSADLTVAEARAKGYITGTLKKEEFFKVSKRVTNPTTIYKKQKLDRDDLVDITDFDVVAWLKGEMRLMLDEELARAILVGDGRAVDDEDKIDEDSIRPIATDHEVYTTVGYVNIDNANSSFQEVIDAIVTNRRHLRGSGMPTMFTSETYIAQALLLKDTLGRNLYPSLDALATELRVSSIVPVEVLEETPEIVAILVNLADYVVGADKGGAVGMFDDFDIDYNQYKYLIETRASGALSKLKSALVVKAVSAGDALVVPAAPAFTGQAVTITNQAGVIYRNADTDTVMNAAGSPYAVAEDVTLTVVAEPDTGYYFSSSEGDTWSFTGVAP